MRADINQLTNDLSCLLPLFFNEAKNIYTKDTSYDNRKKIISPVFFYSKISVLSTRKYLDRP